MRQLFPTRAASGIADAWANSLDLAVEYFCFVSMATWVSLIMGLDKKHVSLGE